MLFNGKNTKNVPFFMTPKNKVSHNIPIGELPPYNMQLREIFINNHGTRSVLLNMLH